MRRSVCFGVAAFALLLSLLVVPAAGAAPGGGAVIFRDQKIDQRACQSAEGYTFCSTLVGSLQAVTSPTGNQSYTVDTAQCSTVTEDATGAIIQQQCYAAKGHQLSRDQVLQALGVRSSTTSTYLGHTCVFTQVVHMTNDGQVQFDVFSSICQ